MSDWCHKSERFTASHMKVLYVSWSVPPAAIGSGIVAANLLRYLRKEEAMAVGAFYAGSPRSEWSPVWPEIHYGMWQPPESWRGERWIRLAQWPFLVARAWFVSRRFGATHVVVTYPDALFLTAGLLVAAVARIPYSVYFHNSLIDRRPASARMRWLESRAVASASTVFVISPGLADLVSARYPDARVVLLPHAAPGPPVGPDEVTVPPWSRPIHLVLAGSINESCADAARRLFEFVRRAEDVELTVYSGMQRAALERMGCLGRGIRIERVPQEDLQDCLRKADVLLHPHGFTGSYPQVEYETIFPTRTVDYLAAGRPILAHLPEKCCLADFYRQNDCAVQVHEASVEAIDRAFRSLAAGGEPMRIRLAQNAARASARFDPAAVASLLREQIG